MRLLTSVNGSFEAHVIRARLEDEGLDPELRGDVLHSPYPFTMGRMSKVFVYVPEDQMEDARLVLLSSEVDAAFEEAVHEPSSVPARPWSWWLAAGLVVVLVVLALARACGVG